MTHATEKSPCHKQGKRRLTRDKFTGFLLHKLKMLQARLKLAIQINNERRTLSTLSEYHLRDIGLTRDQVNNEVGHSIFDTSSARYSDLGYLQQATAEPKTPTVRRLPDD